MAARARVSFWQHAPFAMLDPPAVPPVATFRRHRAASLGAELAAAAEWARENLQASAEFRAWICIPDLGLRRAEVEDAFDAALAAQRFSLSPRELPSPYAVAGGTPLGDYAPVRAALNALSATTGSVSFEEFSVLLRMPELQSTAGRCQCRGDPRYGVA